MRFRRAPCQHPPFPPGGERYANTYYSDEWLREKELDPALHEPALEAFLTGKPLELKVDESWG